MRQVLPADEFGPWLTRFLRRLDQSEPSILFQPATVADRSDGRIAHLDGLNFTRAWCWNNLASGLTPADPRCQIMHDAARRHLEASLPARLRGLHGGTLARHVCMAGAGIHERGMSTDEALLPPCSGTDAPHRQALRRHDGAAAGVFIAGQGRGRSGAVAPEAVSTGAFADPAPSATLDPILALPAEPPPDERISITRETLRDGSLLSAARLRMPPGTTLLSDAAGIEADLDAKLSRHPPGADVWLFGYGSLMWNPAIKFAERRPGALHGWHRRFCLWLHMGRGSPDNPGLMLALERGGAAPACCSASPPPKHAPSYCSPGGAKCSPARTRSCWVTAMTGTGPVRAATFVADRAHPRYAGQLDEASVAARLASATGSLGSCAAYLAETLRALQAAGLRDRTLERLRLLTGPQER